MKRLRNYGLWLSIAAFIPLILDSLKVYNINVILPSNWDAIAKAFLAILVLAGILSNPTTDNTGYLDDKSQEK